MEFALRDGQVEVVDGGNVSEAFGEAADFQRRRGSVRGRAVVWHVAVSD